MAGAGNIVSGMGSLATMGATKAGAKALTSSLGGTVGGALGSAASFAAGPLAIAGIGMAMYDAWSGANDAAKQAKKQIKALGVKIGTLGSEMNEAGGNLREDIDDIIASMGGSISGLTAGASSTLDQLSSQYSSIIKAGKGLKTGAADLAVQKGQRSVAEQMDRDLNQLYDETGGEISASADQYQGFMTDARAQMQDMQSQIETLEQSNSVWENLL